MGDTYKIQQRQFFYSWTLYVCGRDKWHDFGEEVFTSRDAAKQRIRELDSAPYITDEGESGRAEYRTRIVRR